MRCASLRTASRPRRLRQQPASQRLWTRLVGLSLVTEVVSWLRFHPTYHPSRCLPLGMAVLWLGKPTPGFPASSVAVLDAQRHCRLSGLHQGGTMNDSTRHGASTDIYNQVSLFGPPRRPSFVTRDRADVGKGPRGTAIHPSSALHAPYRASSIPVCHAAIAAGCRGRGNCDGGCQEPVGQSSVDLLLPRWMT